MTVQIQHSTTHPTGTTLVIVEGANAADVATELEAVLIRLDRAPAERGKTFEEKVVTGEVATPPTTTVTKPKKAKPVIVDSGKTATPPPATDPTDLTSTAPQISTGEERKGPEDDATDLSAFTATEQPVTDKDISDAITRKAATLQTTKKSVQDIKDLIAKYNVKHVSALPQSVRKEFLTKLDALT